MPNTSNQKKRLNDQTLLPCLHVLNGLRANETIIMDQSCVLMGRSDAVDIRFMDENVTAQHARLEKIAHGYTLTDLTQHQLTKINDLAISQASLQENDCIGLGATKIQFMFKTYEQLCRLMAKDKKMRLDKTTQLLNKEYFESLLAKEIQISRSSHMGMSCVLLSFHPKNKSDIAQRGSNDWMKQMSDFLSKTTREYDVLCRFQKRTFAVMLRNTVLDNALLFLKRIQKQLQQEFAFDIVIKAGVSEFNQEDALFSTSKMLEQAQVFYESALTQLGHVHISKRSI